MKNILFAFIVTMVIPCFSQDKTAFDFQTTGNGFLQQENYTAAMQNYNLAIEIYSSKNDLINLNMLGKCQYYRATCKQNLEDYRGAINDYTKTIEILGKLKSNIDNFYNSSFYYRGFCKLLINDKEGGCQDFSKSGELGYSKSYEMIKKYCIDLLDK
jgi:tetratricopeptide (TPR) repeat protein